ncbi:hypothetical protein R3P38DRAFT_3361802 [Favolaschia claudopus]|uniref:Uncharacterized protein n=1 Tax=Favolaschia claudopus TaxID=2862362 RepID=A0AAW0ASL9_9AGAR
MSMLMRLKNGIGGVDDEGGSRSMGMTGTSIEEQAAQAGCKERAAMRACRQSGGSGCTYRGAREQELQQAAGCRSLVLKVWWEGKEQALVGVGTFNYSDQRATCVISPPSGPLAKPSRQHWTRRRRTHVGGRGGWREIDPQTVDWASALLLAKTTTKFRQSQCEEERNQAQRMARRWDCMIKVFVGKIIFMVLFLEVRFSFFDEPKLNDSISQFLLPI